jgi:hypothetical protein
MQWIQDNDLSIADAGGGGDCFYHAVGAILGQHPALQSAPCDRSGDNWVVRCLRHTVADLMVTPGSVADHIVQGLVESRALDAELYESARADHANTWTADAELRAMVRKLGDDDYERPAVVSAIADHIASEELTVWASELEVKTVQRWLCEEHCLNLVVVDITGRDGDVALSARECDACGHIAFVFKNGAHYQYLHRRGRTVFDMEAMVMGRRGGGSGAGVATNAGLLFVALLAALLPR